MRRREFVQSAGVPMLAPAAGRLPNILVILSDDHSASYLGCYGDTVIRTPNLDRLAQGGMRFTKFYVASPQCSPSRAALMSGRSPHAIGCSRLHAPYRPEMPSIVDALRERGYYTGGFRKVHLGGAFEKRFDYYSNAAPFSAFFERVPAGRPFFYWMGYTEPHRPYNKKTPQVHDPARVRVPKNLPDTPAVRADLAQHYDALAQLDRQCGEVFDLLESRKLAENTLVFFMGDNGMPYPRAKATLYQPGVNTPLIVRWPGRVKAGSVSDALVSSLDLPATWLDAAGAKPLPAMEGLSLTGLLTGAPRRQREVVFTERNWHDTWEPARSVVTRRFSLITNYRPEVSYRGSLDHVNQPDWNNQNGYAVWNSIVAEHKAGRLHPALSKSLFGRPRPLYELYDLESDPDEFQNLAGEVRVNQIETRLRSALTTWMTETNDFLPPPNALPPLAGGNTRELPLSIWLDGYLP